MKDIHIFGSRVIAVMQYNFNPVTLNIKKKKSHVNACCNVKF